LGFDSNINTPKYKSKSSQNLLDFREPRNPFTKKDNYGISEGEVLNHFCVKKIRKATWELNKCVK